MATQADLLTRRAAFAPDTYNADAGTVEAVISTFAPVQRKGFMERLDPAGLDTSRLIGAPVLDGHRQGSARDVIGTIAGHRMEDGKLVATIRLSGAADAVPIVERIREGTIKGVSIGYRVTRWADSTDPNSRARVRTAAAWSISEVSAVETATETRAAIRQICRSANMTAEQADDMIDRDLSITEARAEAFEAMQRRTPARIRTAAPANDDPAVTMTRRADALYARVSGEAPSDEARPFMGESLRDMARACVEASGVSTRAMEADTLFRAAMNTTSDFPSLLTSTGNRTLTAAYQAAQSPVKTALARRSTMAVFRPGTRLKLSDIGTLEKVSESGEIKHTSRGEASESYALDTYATQFAISRKALINDDLGAFRDWGSTAGRMAAETESNLLLTLLLGNPTMGEDGKALFHADHGNLAGTGAALGDAGAGLTALSSARLALRGMKALDGKTPINATPKFLLVGPEQETEAEKLLAEIAAATVADVNPFAKRLSLLVEPRITDDQWFVFADPAKLPVLEYSYLSSAQGPQMASREGWDVLGMEFRVVLDFGCGAVDWRGAYMNAGE
jgi:phage head maturation protease